MLRLNNDYHEWNVQKINWQYINVIKIIFLFFTYKIDVPISI
jgi:hypothetical protein